MVSWDNLFSVDSDNGEEDCGRAQTRVGWFCRCGVLSRRGGVPGKEGKTAAAIAKPKGCAKHDPRETAANALTIRHLQSPKWMSQKIAPSTATEARPTMSQCVFCCCTNALSAA